MVLFTDETWFHLSGYVYSQNYQTWRTETPHNYTETALHPQKIGMWCAISRRQIIGPLFFETSINAETYQELIQQFIAVLLGYKTNEGIERYVTLLYDRCKY
jgi:hypothetical protein